MAKSYAGVGSRETPVLICEEMKTIARWLRIGHGYTLRSGAADRADKAFESGAGLAKEIYLPWRGFNGSDSDLVFDEMPEGLQEKAYDLTFQYHPNPYALSLSAAKLMARNAFQVLGKTLNDPVEFVVCWTKDGKASGGTGQAIRIAAAYGIRVCNLRQEEASQELFEYVGRAIRKHVE